VYLLHSHHQPLGYIIVDKNLIEEIVKDYNSLEEKEKTNGIQRHQDILEVVLLHQDLPWVVLLQDIPPQVLVYDQNGIKQLLELQVLPTMMTWTEKH
jgi:hypothetical protein